MSKNTIPAFNNRLDATLAWPTPTHAAVADAVAKAMLRDSYVKPAMTAAAPAEHMLLDATAFAAFKAMGENDPEPGHRALNDDEFPTEEGDESPFAGVAELMASFMKDAMLELTEGLQDALCDELELMESSQKFGERLIALSELVGQVPNLHLAKHRMLDLDADIAETHAEIASLEVCCMGIQYGLESPEWTRARLQADVLKSQATFLRSLFDAAPTPPGYKA